MDGALTWVDKFDGCWAHERMEGRLAQMPSLLGRQLEQGFPAFTQAHPLQEPVLLHLQHGIAISGCGEHDIRISVPFMRDTTRARARKYRKDARCGIVT